MAARKRKGSGTSGVPKPGPLRRIPGNSAQLRLWVVAGGAISFIGLAAVAAATFLSGGNGPTHTIVTPSNLGAYVRRPQLEKQMNARRLQQEVIAKGAGQASHVVYAVYEDNGGLTGGATPQIILFIGGNLSGVSPSAFIASFTDQYKGARATSPGSMGGLAACVNSQPNMPGVALCTWADNDTFGMVASPTLGASQLAGQLRVIRPSVERHVK